MAFNPLNMLGQAEKIKETAARLEEKLLALRIIGEAGGGLVKVTLNGRFECLGVQLDAAAVDPRDIEMLQSLIKSAYTDAFNKVKNALSHEVQDAGLGGLASMFK